MSKSLRLEDRDRRAIRACLSYAAHDVYIPGESALVPGDDPKHVVELDSFRCVFSFTRMRQALYRDLSVSILGGDGGLFPSIHAFFCLAREFGFTGWDGETFLPMPEGWQIGKDVDAPAIRVVQAISHKELTKEIPALND